MENESYIIYLAPFLDKGVSDLEATSVVDVVNRVVLSIKERNQTHHVLRFRLAARAEAQSQSERAKNEIQISQRKMYFSSKEM